MASVNKCGRVVQSFDISRGDGTEAFSLDLNKIENLIVYDENGCEVRVGDIYKNQKTIIILVRVCQIRTLQSLFSRCLIFQHYVVI